MKIQVYRTTASSYQDKSFFQAEKQAIEAIENVTYIKSLNEIEDDSSLVMISNTHTKPAQLPDALIDKTVLMIHPNSGYDNYNYKFIKSQKFPIVLGNPIRSNAVAEYILGCVFSHYSKIPAHQHWDEKRTWSRKLLRDQKVLIIGNGHIGKLIRRTLTPVTKNVHTFDPYYSSEIHENIHNELSDKVIKNTDILIIASSLNSENFKGIDKLFLKKLSNECLIVNAARGKLVNEEDLVYFLQKNPKSYAFIDVYEKEPFTPGHLGEVSNLNKTSHIAGVYKDLNKDIIEFEKNIISQFIHYAKDEKQEQFKQDFKSCLLTERIKDDMVI